MVSWRRALPLIGAACVGTALALGLGTAYADAEPQEGASAPVAATDATYPTVAIYRLYNRWTGEHLYTPSSSERDACVDEGWAEEGTGWYAPRSSGTPVYRLYNPYAGYHLYSSDLDEVRSLASLGWRVENDGKAYFLSGGEEPMLRLYNPNSGLHLLTESTDEYRFLEQCGWVPEGIRLYASGVSRGSASWPMGECAIATEESEGALEASVSLSGVGEGAAARLVALAGDASVGFGLRAGGDPAESPVEFLVENALGDDAQTVKLVSCGFGELGSTYRLLMEIQPTGVVDVYVNGVRVKSVKNPGLAGSAVELRLEAAGASVGDEVQATFSDVKLKDRGRYRADEAYGWRTRIADDACGVTANLSQFPTTVTLGGTVSDLADGEGARTMRGVGSVSLTRR